MDNFFLLARDFAIKAITDRDNYDEEFQPSQYWSDFARNFRYVYDLLSDELIRIRYHTYHLTSDSYLTYYFADNGFRNLLTTGYNHFIVQGQLTPYDEGINGIGVDSEYGRISHDLLRYVGAVFDIKKAGLLTTSEHQVVLEIGGGYGGLARSHLTQNNNLSYIICDLEETLFFSAIYLATHFGSERIHLVNAKLYSEELEKGHVYIVPQSQRSFFSELHVSYAISQQSLQEMTLKQAQSYLNWIDKHCDHFYSCNVNDHGTLASEKQIVTNLIRILENTFGPPIWLGPKPAENNRFGDNHLPRSVFRCHSE